jgi:6-pyruvoyltetrahydropterin/6-carboxytetrahydropterin synthase
VYTLAVRRNFISRYFLVGGNWGPEGFPSSHNYHLELQLQARDLNQRGYVADIMELSKDLDELVAYFGEKLLNDLPEFRGLNPSMENFARILAMVLDKRIHAVNITMLTVKLSRDGSYWASYDIDRTVNRPSAFS